MPLRVARLEPRDVLGSPAERRVGLRDDLIRAAEAVEIVHIKRTQINLHRFEYIRERHPLRFGLHAVHVRVELRHIDLITRECAGESGRLPGLADNFLRGRIELLVTQIGAVLDVKLETINSAQAVYRRWWKDCNERFLDSSELLVQ